MRNKTLEDVLEIHGENINSSLLNLSNFNCGYNNLNEYLKETAKIDSKTGVNK
ncbi:hypothetical protein WR164_01380 [Philodulcilactobacillus myokoensis]|uniref:Uncharacterized protein n=1 Tax=Philodulcilactobacillus myokoensis TaxID=2929573 RepID=A0A9W6AYU6_9LACO|nr:hypothetical protein [Philodulcilactobacillus myokoensis]GLB46159.1 hypothetical protein WR164_01380 [Philodulcilactobacillus myokoensis]